MWAKLKFKVKLDEFIMKLFGYLILNGWNSRFSLLKIDTDTDVHMLEFHDKNLLYEIIMRK